jgi:Ca2+-binding EF-hand superfamily protein
MLYGSISFSWNRERSDAPIHSHMTSETAQWMGFMDADMDGLVAKEEMPQRLRKSIGWRWWFLDDDKDGSLNLAELEVLMRRLTENSGP